MQSAVFCKNLTLLPVCVIAVNTPSYCIDNKKPFICLEYKNKWKIRTKNTKNYIFNEKGDLNKDTIEKENNNRNKNNVRKKKGKGNKRKESYKKNKSNNNNSSKEKLKTAFALRDNMLKKLNDCLFSKRWDINTLLMFDYF